MFLNQKPFILVQLKRPNDVMLGSNEIFLNPLFTIPVISGVSIIVVGAIMYYFPPKKINPFYGYRTYNSMQSQAKWDFAQVYMSKEMIIWGLVLVFCAVPGLFYTSNSLLDIFVGLLYIAVCVGIPFFRTETQLKKR